MLWLSLLASFTFSLIAKLCADAFLTDRIAVLGSFVGFQYAQNSGVAFSIRFPGPLQPFLIGIALLLIAWTATHAKTTLSKIAFGLILGGALGNIVDRLRDGFVTDFVQVGSFPIFNAADSFITIGVLALLFEAMIQWRRR